MITAPRPVPTVDESLRDLRHGGFTGPIQVFAEPNAHVHPAPGVRIRWNSRRFGMWSNWMHCAATLLRETDARWLLICEDDIRLARGAANALRIAADTLPAQSWGYASLFTPRHNAEDSTASAGWQSFDLGWRAIGSLAYCFTRESLIALLHSKTILLHAETKGTDSIISEAFARIGRKLYFHLPSLCDHSGADNSSVGHATFPGHAAIGFDPEFVPDAVPA